MSKRKPASRRSGFSASKWWAPSILSLIALAGFPGMASRADITAMLIADLDQPQGWRSALVPAAAGSIHQQELVFAGVDANTKGTSANRGLVLPNGKLVALSADTKSVPATPDEDRVNRKAKKGRIVAIERIRPPKDFTAGTILDRQASIFDPEMIEGQKTAFIKSDIIGKEVEIALAFHKNRAKIDDYGVPAMLASLVTNDEADSLATAYANPEPDYAEQSPFDSILTEKKTKRFVPEIDKAHHNWANSVLPATVFTKAEQKCLAEAIYFESVTEPLKGQAAVAQVILNRVRNPTFPKTICGVVYQNEDWRNRCQFSFACDRIPDRVGNKVKFSTAMDIALAVTAGKIYLKEVGDSTHYHATYVRPDWARTMKKVGRIGLHIFYRTKRGGWI